MRLPPPSSSLFPYTTLFRSHVSFLAEIGLRVSATLVYVVDDDDAMRDSLRWLLESTGYRVSAHSTAERDRKSTRLNSSHLVISYAVFCLKKKKLKQPQRQRA